MQIFAQPGEVAGSLLLGPTWNRFLTALSHIFIVSKLAFRSNCQAQNGVRKRDIRKRSASPSLKRSDVKQVLEAHLQSLSDFL
jgi:hypothetical protein